MELDKCQLCRRYVSVTRQGRVQHMKTFHGVTVQVAPLSAVELREVISRVETRLGAQNFFAPSQKVEATAAHSEECRCEKCIQTMLDRILAKQEAVLEEPEVNYVG